MDIGFDHFFRGAMEGQANPYPYQKELALEPWPDLLTIPTGLGKTAAVILAWFYKRLQGDEDTPRRLAYCLPMRTLVEQTADNARKWFQNLVSGSLVPHDWQPSIYVLMGGEVDEDWDIWPEKEAVLIGTQDQLLSRALNRGYAMSRFRWPMHFGLLHNDCLWVMDEVQLMGAGLATTTQLQTFRKQFGTVLPCRSLWMSATLQRSWLETVDFLSDKADLVEAALTAEDKSIPALKMRFEAGKSLQKADVDFQDMAGLSKLVLETHKAGTRTLAVVNTVRRARELFQALEKEKPAATLVLLHSRFRPGDRAAALEKLLTSPPEEGTICISTQVVEAGVDVSAAALITDLAPWPSMVQRFGRCNREGERSDAKVFWIDVDLKQVQHVAPYEINDLQEAAERLLQLKDVGPGKLDPSSNPFPHRHVLRKKDLLDLFDTTPDLAGADIDVSRFIREEADRDVSVFWRNVPETGPEADEPAPNAKELCSVSIADAIAFKERHKWRFDFLEKQWVLADSLSPGMVLLFRPEAGGYHAGKGWTGEKKDIPEVLVEKGLPEEAYDDDQRAIGTWQSLGDHSTRVIQELKTLLDIFPQLEQAFLDALLTAARWHDAGKAHPVCQRAMLGEPPEKDSSIIWAKTARSTVRYERRGFRHELASALAMLNRGLPDLAAYLAAAHHGKVRLSIRSLPMERSPREADRRFARGIWEGDELPSTELGGAEMLTPTTLDLSYMELGEGPQGPSWLARTLALRDASDIGPFRLAFLESLLRVADWRASRLEEAKNA